MPVLIVKKESDFDKLLDALKEKYMAEGMSEFDARMKAVMSDEAQAKIYPGLHNEEKEEHGGG